MTDEPKFTAQNPLRIGTRQSPLAMAQAQLAASEICRVHGLAPDAVALRPMLSSGDKIQDRPLAEIGGKALWTKELERALLDGDIDLAVHSMKDVETLRPDIFHMAAMLPRADVRDRLIGADSIAALPLDAHIGTSSPRRAAQLKSLRPDLVISAIRGNVATRMAQIDDGSFDATILAAAGLNRLGYHDVGAVIETDQMLPAASQGAIGIDCLSSRQDIAAILGAVNDAKTYDCVMAERAFLAALGGDCHSPVAALAVLYEQGIYLRGEILAGDGASRYAGDIRFAAGDHDDGPRRLASQLIAQADSRTRALFCR
jgi:hydroxymethylbilane synthase